MAHLFKGTAVLKNTLSVKSVLGLSLVMALTACSSDANRYKREVNGNDSYLNSVAPETLVWPTGISAPLPSNDYLIPAATQGAVGKQVDIRPPVQVMPLLKGARTQLDSDTAVVTLDSSVYSVDNLWRNLLGTLQREKIAIAAQTPADMTLTTDWVSWRQGSDNETVRARYQISVKGEDYNTQLVSRLTDLQDSTGQSITVATERSRYNAMMLNRIMMSMDEQVRTEEAARLATENSDMPVIASQDNTGLPVYVVRAGYDSVWARLPETLAKLGFSVDDRNRPQGQLTLSYRNIGDDGWKALGTSDPELPGKAYKLQVGDLGNRTTIALTDSDGKPLSDSVFKALLPAMQAAFGNNATP
ncbi:MAG: outer membrane protein assembly factor BamC [Plesiomonas sp.]|uniref:outer membrane protein assembly factor BamC n=1 Tax=Plesiomonas sp. TaxID=2486279 RepID=UPI003F2A0564